MTNEQKDIERYPKQFISLFRNLKYKSIFIRPSLERFYTRSRYGISPLESTCVKLIIAKHLKPDSNFFNLKDNNELLELNTIVNEFVKKEIFKNVATFGMDR